MRIFADFSRSGFAVYNIYKNIDVGVDVDVFVVVNFFFKCTSHF